MNTVKNIRDKFLKEAKNSPTTFIDLASMEDYISESYSSRSIIELLQNADDAESKRFKIISNEDFILVANDGRPFNNDDVISICRSGASTKSRDGISIGYRGIGFKSVVELGNRVHVLSKDIEMTFSRELTQQALDSDIKVPLIRIPHSYSPIIDTDELVSQLIKENYNTFFIIENKNNIDFEQILETFDSTSLLFLNNIKEVYFNFSNLDFEYKIERGNEEQEILLSNTLQGHEYIEEWRVFQHSEGASIAMLVDNNEVIPLDRERAVVHSFMPTRESIGLPFKINGDFSTDPSRTKVVDDSRSNRIVNQILDLIVSLIKLEINEGLNFNGFLTLLNNLKPSKISFEKLINKYSFEQTFKEKLSETILESNIIGDISNGKVRIDNGWLNSNDSEEVAGSLNLHFIKNNVLTNKIGLEDFMKNINVQFVSLDDVIIYLKNDILSTEGAAQFISEIINQNRIIPDEKLLKSIGDLPIILVENKFISINNITNNKKMNEEFLKSIYIEISDRKDFKWLLERIRPDFKWDDIIEIEETEKSEKVDNNKNGFYKDSNTLNINHLGSQKTTDSSKFYKWRSVEMNLTEYLNQLADVISARDVSKSNMGYDIEVKKSIETDYIEVKSVKNFNSTITMTNNEYSTAMSLRDNYYLALVVQEDDSLQVLFIKDPINNIELTRRAKVWEWIADDYEGELFNINF